MNCSFADFYCDNNNNYYYNASYTDKDNLEHIMRWQGFENLCLTGKMEVIAAKGREW